MKNWSTSCELAALCLTAVLALSTAMLGCSAGPEYSPPDLHDVHGDTWRAGPIDGSTGSVADANPVVAWWRRFEDPELERLVREVATGSLVIAEARERIVEARARRGIVNAERLPQLELAGQYASAGTGDGGLSYQGPPPGTRQDLYAADAMAGWEVDLWGRVGNLTKAADRDIEADVESYRYVTVSVAAETALAYLDLRLMEARLALLDRNVELLEGSLRVAESRYAAGSGTQIDVAEARRLLERARARRPDLRRGRTAAFNSIAALLGRPPSEFELGVGTAPQPPRTAAVGIPAQLVTRRADVRSAERRYAASIARVGAAIAGRYPRLSLFGSIGFQSGGAARVFTPDALVYSLGPGLTFPLSEGGRIESNVHVQQSRAEQARLALERTLLQAVVEVENTVAGVVETQRRWESLARAAADARSSVELAEQLYRAGTADLLYVLDCEKAVIDTEDARAVARRDLLGETVRLYRSLGGGWPELEAPFSAGRLPSPPSAVAAAPEAGDTEP